MSSLQGEDMENTTAKHVPIQLFVSRQFVKDGKDVGLSKSTDELIAVRRFETEPARVTVEMGMTINLGNYEAARISVSLSAPCYFEERDLAFEFSRAWVEKRTLEEAEEARKFAQNRNKAF